MERTKLNENIVEEALNHTGFGWFNIKVYLVVMLAFINVAVSTGNIGLTLTAVVCDFELLTVSQSYIAMMPMLGLTIGQYLWVFFTQTKGRRKCLIICLCLHGLSEGAASIIPNFYGFLFCKFMTGVAMCGQLVILYTYLGEFQPSKYRSRFFASIEIFWGFGFAMAAGLGWAIIPLNINLFTTSYFSFHSWNLYLLVCSLLAPITAFWFCFLPETPKYLADNGYNRELVQVLGEMYHVNTGRPVTEFMQKVENLEGKQLYNSLVNIEDINMHEKKFIETIKELFYMTIEILQPPYLRTTIILALSAYGVMFTYFTIAIWLPEVLERVENVRELSLNNTNSICIPSHVLNPSSITNTNTDDSFSTFCSSKLDSKVYLENLALGIASIPGSLFITLLVTRFGMKLIIILLALLSSIFGFSSIFTNNSIQTITLFFLFSLMSTLGVVLILSIVIEYFPTHLRITASAFINLSGRSGGVIGNYLFGLLIDDYCQITIVITALHVAVAGLIVIFLPKVGLEQLQLPKKRLENNVQKSVQSTSNGYPDNP